MNRPLRLIGATAFLVAGIAVAQASARNIVIGVELPVTGPFATWAGVTPHQGIELATDEVNASHALGADKLKIVFADVASDKTQAITVTNAFIQRDHVCLIIGPSTTVLSAAVVPIANQAKIPILTLSASDVITKSGPYAFKMITSAGPDMADLSDFAVRTLKVKNYVSLYNRDNDAYVEYNRDMRADMKMAGVPVLSEDSTLASDTDFTSLATKLADLHPDAIFIGMLAEQAANVVIQARQAGLSDKVKIFGQGGGIYPNYARIGGKAVDGTYFLTHYYVGLETPANRDFATQYKARYHADPDEMAAFGYAAVRLAVKAIRDAGSTDPGKLRAALAAIRDVPSVLGRGTFSFDENRSPVYHNIILQLRNGAPVLAK